MLNPWFEEKLEQRKSNDLFRTLVTPAGMIDFTSNDYLGLALSPKLFQDISEKIQHAGLTLNGAGGSRLLSGNSVYTETVEARLAAIFKGNTSLIFNSGYSANLAVLSSIPQRGDFIVYDELVHASIKDGCRLSQAKRFSFRHNDLSDLENKIKKTDGRVFIVVESIYSMNGDECPLPEVVQVAEKYNASIILDEAHSTGVVGEQGGGLAISLGLEDKIDIRVYTFGKAMGIHGACVVGADSLRQYLINFARPFIYTTALPLHSIVSIACSFDYLNKNLHLQEKLHKNVITFLNAIHGTKNLISSKSAIQTVVFPGNKNARSAAHALQKENYDVRPILSPTVSAGSERLRICLHTFNTDNEIIQLCNLLKNLSAQA